MKILEPNLSFLITLSRVHRITSFQLFFSLNPLEISIRQSLSDSLSAPHFIQATVADDH